MNLGDVTDQTVPKMCLVSEPRNGGIICTRTFIPHVCHESIGVLGAVSVATACLLPGSVAADFAGVANGREMTIVVEHPSGSLSVRIVTSETDRGGLQVEKAGVIRTARMLFRGDAYVRSA